LKRRSSFQSRQPLKTSLCSTFKQVADERCFDEVDMADSLKRHPSMAGLRATAVREQFAARSASSESGPDAAYDSGWPARRPAAGMFKLLAIVAYRHSEGSGVSLVGYPPRALNPDKAKAIVLLTDAMEGLPVCFSSSGEKEKGATAAFDHRSVLGRLRPARPDSRSEIPSSDSSSSRQSVNQQPVSRIIRRALGAGQVVEQPGERSVRRPVGDRGDVGAGVLARRPLINSGPPGGACLIARCQTSKETFGLG